MGHSLNAEEVRRDSESEIPCQPTGVSGGIELGEFGGEFLLPVVIVTVTFHNVPTGQAASAADWR